MITCCTIIMNIFLFFVTRNIYHVLIWKQPCTSLEPILPSELTKPLNHLHMLSCLHWWYGNNATVLRVVTPCGVALPKITNNTHPTDEWQVKRVKKEIQCYYFTSLPSMLVWESIIISYPSSPQLKKHHLHSFEDRSGSW